MFEVRSSMFDVEERADAKEILNFFQTMIMKFFAEKGHILL